MAANVLSDPGRRQVLVNLGNRYVVFGPYPEMPQEIGFDPTKDAELLPRVADESDVAAERIAQTLKVLGAETSWPKDIDTGWDLELVGSGNNRVRVEIKVRDRDPKAKELESWIQHLKTYSDSPVPFEIWNFNIERLRLKILRLDKASMPSFSNLVALDVWEVTPTSILRRAQVVERVKEWSKRIQDLYNTIGEWLSEKPQYRADQTRTVTMSEELMQKYAVPDQELPILDIQSGEQVVASFVPRALWIIGGRGRVDVITQSGTRLLVDKGELNAPDWQLISAATRREAEAFKAPVFYNLVGEP